MLDPMLGRTWGLRVRRSDLTHRDRCVALNDLLRCRPGCRLTEPNKGERVCRWVTVQSKRVCHFRDVLRYAGYRAVPVRYRSYHAVLVR